jgi:hypothetical protein
MVNSLISMRASLTFINKNRITVAGGCARGKWRVAACCNAKTQAFRALQGMTAWTPAEYKAEPEGWNGASRTYATHREDACRAVKKQLCSAGAIPARQLGRSSR